MTLDHSLAVAIDRIHDVNHRLLDLESRLGNQPDQDTVRYAVIELVTELTITSEDVAEVFEALLDELNEPPYKPHWTDLFRPSRSRLGKVLEFTLVSVLGISMTAYFLTQSIQVYSGLKTGFVPTMVNTPENTP